MGVEKNSVDKENFQKAQTAAYFGELVDLNVTAGI